MHMTSRASPEAAGRLLEAYAAAPSAEARDRIVEAYLYIAEIIARRFSGRGVEYDDLYQVAALALVKAVERYDPARGVQFASFATPSMVGEVKNYFRDRSRAIRVPRRGVALLREIERARDRLAQSLGRMPRADELAGAVGVGEDAVLEALEAGGMTLVSLDAAPEGGEDDGAELSAFLGIEERGYSDFERADVVRRAMDALEARAREIIELRYFWGLSQREVAGRLGVSQMTVSREERRALEAMRLSINDPDS